MVSSGILQNYLVFISVNKYVDFFSGCQTIYSRKSKGMSEEGIKNPPGLNDTFASSLIDYRPLWDVKFGGNCLRKSSTSAHRNVVNLYISYTLDTWSRNFKVNLTSGICLFKVVKSTKNADSDKYGSSGYGIGFDVHSQFSLPDGTILAKIYETNFSVSVK